MELGSKLQQLFFPLFSAICENVQYTFPLYKHILFLSNKINWCIKLLLVSVNKFSVGIGSTSKMNLTTTSMSEFPSSFAYLQVNFSTNVKLKWALFYNSSIAIIENWSARWWNVLTNRSYFRWDISSRVFSGVPETSSFHILLITALKTILFDVNAD